MDHRAWKSSVPEQFDYKADTPDVELPHPELAEAESILNAMGIFSSSLPVYGHPTTLSGAETRFRSAPATTGADGIMTVDDNGTIESFNEAAEKIFKGHIAIAFHQQPHGIGDRTASAMQAMQFDHALRPVR